MADAEFSWIVALSALPPEGKSFSLSLPDRARFGVAARLGVPGVKSLDAEIFVRPAADGVMVEGDLKAHLIRECVATLEPMDEEVGDHFAIRFSRKAAHDGAEALLVEEETPEPLEGDEIDLGEILVQQLALAMDPYPRRADAPAVAREFGPEAGSGSPFAVLKGVIAPSRDEE